MRSFLAPPGLKVAQAFFQRPCLLAFDFDGTLCPLAKTPAQAKIAERTAKILIELQQTNPIAVISGRAKADLLRHLPWRPNFAVGNHGVEGLFDPEKFRAAQATAQAWAAQLANNYLLQQPGIYFENKTYSLAIYYKACHSYFGIGKALLQLVQRLRPLPSLILGKHVINLLPAKLPRKGDALLEILRQTGYEQAFYLGDDVTDDDVFRLKDERILAVRVGRKIKSPADFYLPAQKDVYPLLKRIQRWQQQAARQAAQNFQKGAIV
jgi:trehalose 6-phosphate phosphatase